MGGLESTTGSKRQHHGWGRVAGEQIDMIFTHLPMAVLPPILAATLVAYLFRNHVHHSSLQLWVLWVSLSYLILPSTLAYLYRRTPLQDRDPERWGRRYILMAIPTASSWGAAGILLFVPDSPLHQVFIGGILFTSAAAVMATSFSYTPAYYAGVLPIFLPLVYSMIKAGELVHQAMSIVIVTSFIMLCYFQRNMNQTLTESLLLRHDREDLVRELQRKHEEARQANLTKSRFLASISHDLRQPIHAQQLLLGELSARLPDESGRSVIDLLQQSMASTRSLLDGLLELSRLDAGVVDVRPKDFELEPLLHRIEDELRALVDEKGLQLRVTHCRRRVHSDPMLLERIVRNLAHNAVRYTDSGTVMIACRRRNNRVQIQIRDSGPGIPAHQQALIFEEFSQLAGSSGQSSPGLGLGLSIVQRLAQLLGHEVSLRSAPGRGSIFSVFVPLATEHMIDPSMQRTDNVIVGDLTGLRILAIDDDPTILQALRLLFDRWGCKTRLTTDPAVALGWVRDGSFMPEVLVSDYCLAGGESGLAWIERIRMESSREIPAVLITGDTAPERLREARDSRAILVHKPVDPDMLRGLLFNLRPEDPNRLSAIRVVQ